MKSNIAILVQVLILVFAINMVCPASIEAIEDIHCIAAEQVATETPEEESETIKETEAIGFMYHEYSSLVSCTALSRIKSTYISSWRCPCKDTPTPPPKPMGSHS